MKIATWNVNSINARLPHVLDWFDEAQPDVACLQEIKCVDEKFPAAEFEDRGYNVAVHGQKTYNGVAFLSKFPMEDVMRGLPGDKDDEQARFIEAMVTPEDAAPVRIAGLYLPNGNPAPGPKYDYKLAWMARLKKHAAKRLLAEEPYIMCGDYNVIPAAEDVHDPIAWSDDALYRPETKAAFREIIHLGFTEAFRAVTSEPHLYSFWDYQKGAWPKDNGIRIDHHLLSPQAADRLNEAGIDKQTRGREKPSDHVPVWITLS